MRQCEIDLQKLLPAPQQIDRFDSRMIFADGQFRVKALPRGKRGLLLLRCVSNRVKY
jgi:hypothetical protein